MRLLFSLFLLSAILWSCGPTPGGPASADQLSIDYDKIVLENGLEVIFHEDTSDPIVAVAILFNVGSNREKPDRTGFAHFFEHMLFQNSENVGKGRFFTMIDEMGGELNGGTWQDGTIYYEVIPRDALERVLWMESDRMGFMINTVTEAVLENEKQVVKNEKRQRVDNQPYGHTDYVVGKALYPADHPYNWQVIGSLEHLQAATIDDVKEFYDKWYGPNNATIVIAGDFDRAQTEGWVRKYFAEIPAKETVEPIKPRPGVVEETISLYHLDNFAQLPELTLVWPTVEDGHKDMYALDFLGEVLSEGKRAPLYKELVENKKLASSPNAFNSSANIAGTFQVSVRANADIDLDSVRTAVFAALENFVRDGVSDKDLARIKNETERNFYNGISSVFSKAFQLAQYNEFRNDPAGLEKEIRKIMAVTKEEIMEVFEKYIQGKPYVMTSFVPKGKVELAVEGAKQAVVVEEPIIPGQEAAPQEEIEVAFEKTPSEIDRSVVPPLGQPPVIQEPQVWRSELKNGLEVFGIENDELPLVEFSLRIKGGILLDNRDKMGVSHLVPDLMMEGTAGKTPEELQDAIGQIGANISMSANYDHITLSGNCLSKNFEATMALVREIVLEPRWDPAEFETIKTRRISQIQQLSANPSSIAFTAFTRTLYGSDHQYGLPRRGTLESVSSIAVEDLREYYGKYFSPAVSSFQIAGHIEQERVLEALTGLEEGWPATDVVIPDMPAPIAPAAPRLFFIDIPGSSQSVINIGALAMEGNDGDYFAATVVNDYLGGPNTSTILFQKLREEKGYTYGAQSGFPQRLGQGYFIALTSVRSNVTYESLELLKQILDGYGKDYSEENLKKTKNSLVRSQARAFETLDQKLEILQTAATFGLPLDYMQKDQQTLMNMSIAEAKELISRYINPQQMAFVVVGDKATQLERLTELGLGEPILLDREGLPVQEVAN